MGSHTALTTGFHIREMIAQAIRWERMLSGRIIARGRRAGLARYVGDRDLP